MDLDRVIEILKALEEEGVDYVLVGGAAMNLQGFARATQDVDLFVRTQRTNIDRLRKAFHRLWDDPAIDEISSDDLEGEYAVVRYGPPNEDFVVDVMSRLGEAFAFDDIEHESMFVGDTRIRIATPHMLYRMKRKTVRPIDRIDAAALKERFAFEDD